MPACLPLCCAITRAKLQSLYSESYSNSKAFSLVKRIASFSLYAAISNTISSSAAWHEPTPNATGFQAGPLQARIVEADFRKNEVKRHVPARLLNNIISFGTTLIIYEADCADYADYTSA